MAIHLKSMVALVTGGAVRIGEAICRALACEGCVVAVHYNRSEDDAERLVAGLRSAGAGAFRVKGDLRVEADCRAIVERVFLEAGGMDILVNNAAVFHKDTILTADEDRLMAELQVNMQAPRTLTEAFVQARHGARPGNGESMTGRIVNILGRRIAGVDPETLSYSISKKMLAEYTRQCAVELAPDFTVNGVAPGPVLPPPGREGERTRDWAGEVPLEVRCTPEAVAEAVLYLLKSNSVTGQIIFVDGGQHLVNR